HRDLTADILLVIDFGSLTTDLTIVRADRKDTVRDFGFKLGAGLIDEGILKYSIEAHPEADRVRKRLSGSPSPRARTVCLLRSRRAKEEYFSNPNDYPNADARVHVPGVEIGEGLIFNPIVHREAIDEILAQKLACHRGQMMTWPGALRAILEEVR